MSGLARMASIPELRRRILFTLLMLCVYRMGVQIPTPGGLFADYHVLPRLLSPRQDRRAHV